MVPSARKKASKLIIPWATYTSPELAHVGLSEKDAADAGIAIDTYVQHLSDVDRAILEGQDEGFVKVHTRKGTDQIVGATIVAENAGDLISEITVAMNGGLGAVQDRFDDSSLPDASRSDSQAGRSIQSNEAHPHEHENSGTAPPTERRRLIAGAIQIAERHGRTPQSSRAAKRWHIFSRG